MQHLKNIFTLLSLFLLLNSAHGQDEGPISEMYLKGKWVATCAMEVIDKASMANCDICPFVINPNDKSQAETKDIEMDFQSDSLTINQNGKHSTVAYVRNTNTHAISFSLNDRHYNFRVFFYNKQRILEDGDGLLLVLSKIK